MKIVIVGAGKVGYAIAEQLLLEGHDITVIESDPTRAEYISSTLDVIVVEGKANVDQMRIANVGSADLLIAADCTAYAYGNFHAEFMKNKVTLIGCPKLDPVNYADKLTEILRRNAIKSVTLARMEVPCCGGLERALIQALQDSGKFIPWQVTTLSIRGDILDD